jgi:hypothetical protein
MHMTGRGLQSRNSRKSRIARLSRATGEELMALVSQLTRPEVLAELTNGEHLAAIEASARLDAWTATRRARAVASLHRSVRAEIDEESAAVMAELGALEPRSAARAAVEDRRLAERRAAMELSLAMGTSFAAADRELDLALDLEAHPRLGRALARGELDRAQARVILTGLNQLNATRPAHDPIVAAHRAELLTGFLGPDDSPEGDDFDPDEPITDATVSGLPYPLFRELDRPGVTLWSLSPSRLAAIIRREAARLDRDFLAERAAAARDGRRLDFDPQPDFTADLHLHTSAEHAAAAYRNIDDAARAARRAGDPRTLDQLRADIAVGWLTEGTYGTYVVRPGGFPASEASAAHADDLTAGHSVGPLVHLTVAATTMLGLDEEPGTLHGPRGPIPVPADLARELAHRRGARWRRLLYDPATGVATDLSPSYRPPPLLDAFVRARDGHQTRFPTSSASRLELDHVRPFDRACPFAGGQTRAGNLSSVGKRDHQLKTDRLLRVDGDANGSLTLTTPSGRTYVSHPHAYADAGAPPF